MCLSPETSRPVPGPWSCERNSCAQAVLGARETNPLLSVLSEHIRRPGRALLRPQVNP